MFELKTFAPDLDPRTPGILVDADGVFPSEAGGLSPVPGLVAGASALAAACSGMFNFRDLDGNYRTYAGTTTKLYQLESDVWTDESGSGGAYATSQPWHFAAWGNWVIATAFSGDKPQVQKTNAGTFADLGGTPPYAKYVTVANDFVILAYCNDGSDRPNRVHWSAQGDAEDWTAATATQCGYMDLDDTHGAITGLGKIGNMPLVFKEHDFYLATYIGPPLVWSFRRIGAYGGCPASKAIVETEVGTFFLGGDDFYCFDGSVARRIGKGVREYFYNTVDRNYIDKCFSIYDPVRRLIFWWFPTTNDGTSDCVECLIYDAKTGNWGRWEQEAEAGCEEWKAGMTYDAISGTFATYDAITVATYDDGWWAAKTYNLSIIDGSHILQRLRGTSGTSTFRTGYQGELGKRLEIYQVWPYFAAEPTTCTVAAVERDVLGGTATAGTAMDYSTSTGKVDIIANSPFIALDFSITGDFEIVGVDVEGKIISRN